jgi:hypothetical protein
LDDRSTPTIHLPPQHPPPKLLFTMHSPVTGHPPLYTAQSTPLLASDQVC